MAYTLVEVTTESDWRDYHSLRREVLWEARGQSGYDDRHADEYAPSNHPLLLRLDGRSIGTTRLDDFGDGSGAIRLVAIAAEMRRQGHGRVLSRLVGAYARRLGISALFVNAAPEAVSYYEKMGWEACVWDEAEPTGIAAGANQMWKPISRDT